MIIKDLINLQHYPTKLINMLQKVEDETKRQMIITSGFRLDDKGSHGKALAVDISCTESRYRFHLLKALVEVGFTRIGIYSRHIHADIDDSRDLEVIWYGKYKKK